MSTKIEWVQNPDGTKGETWNVVTGCDPVSEGCAHCYARRMARRLAGRYGYPEAPHHFDVTLRPERLEQPLRWKKPRMIFVCSMGDLFHEDVPLAFVRDVWIVFARTRHHVYQVLTKRPGRMLEFVRQAADFYGEALPNVHLGVSIENQAAADERREYLRQCPAAVKFVSYEPALSPVDWTGWEFVSQIISGGESGPGARPAYPDWHKATRDFCQANEIAYFFKQHGAWLHESQFLKPDAVYHSRVTFKQVTYPMHVWPNNSISYRVGKRAAGRLLDGQTWNEFPGRSEQAQ